MTEIGPPSRTTYSVSGASLADVAAALAHLPEAGRTSWSPSFTERHDGNGTVTEATVRCSLEIEMPVWTERPAASPAAQAEWNRWWSALERHEQGHVDIVVRAFDGLERQMVGVPVARADAIFRAAVGGAQSASDAYDSQTSHGIATGTVLDTSIA